ncbi:ERF family protein [Pediococcus argentinicus]|uniref:ERF family protein n=1 Tax=Pediococcus argentinicus TaxID=480391 RepID=UPI0033907616
MATTKTLFKKLQNIHSKVPYIQKANKSTQYSYAGSSDVLGQIHNLMDEENIILVPEITNHNVDTSANRKGTNVYFTDIEMTMTWINTDNPEERLSSKWYAQGIDTAGEKGVGKALTYGEKYFLLKFFNIATDDMDPDSFQQNVESKKVPEPITKEQEATLNKLFESMAKATGNEVSVVSAGYLKKSKATDVTNLSHDKASALIELVTHQLTKQTEKAGS